MGDDTHISGLQLTMIVGCVSEEDSGRTASDHHSLSPIYTLLNNKWK